MCLPFSLFAGQLKISPQNQLTQSLSLFDSVVNSLWPQSVHTSIILFLTKVDVFKRKLSKSPLERLFPDYNGGSDANKAAKFILWKFMQTNRARMSVYPQYVLAFFSSISLS